MPGHASAVTAAVEPATLILEAPSVPSSAAEGVRAVRLRPFSFDYPEEAARILQTLQTSTNEELASLGLTRGSPVDCSGLLVGTSYEDVASSSAATTSAFVPGTGPVAIKEVGSTSGSRGVPAIITQAPASVAAPAFPIQEEGPLSPAARMKRTAIERVLHTLDEQLRESIQTVLAGECSFEDCKPILQMYVDNLRMLVGEPGAAIYQARLQRVEGDLQDLAVLKDAGLGAAEAASQRAQRILKDREDFLERALTKQQSLRTDIENLNKAGQEMQVESENALSVLELLHATKTQTFAVITEAQEYLAELEERYAQVEGELQELLAKQGIIKDAMGEKKQAAGALEESVHAALQETEADVRRRALEEAEAARSQATQAIEHRLRAL